MSEVGVSGAWGGKGARHAEIKEGTEAALFVEDRGRGYAGGEELVKLRGSGVSECAE